MPRRESGVSPPQIARYLGGVDFPKSTGELVEYAKRRGAPQDAISILQKLPDQTYKSMADVMRGIGKVE